VSMVMLVVVEVWWCWCLWQRIGGRNRGGGVSGDGCAGSDCRVCWSGVSGCGRDISGDCCTVSAVTSVVTVFVVEY
jgi:hypothetical protein